MAIHRFKANESAADSDVVETKVAKQKTAAKKATSDKKTDDKVKNTKKPLSILKPFIGIKNYFVGSWHELRQVRWPNRKQAWAMTLAVILFSLTIGLLIFLLDTGFTLLFKKFIF